MALHLHIGNILGQYTIVELPLLPWVDYTIIAMKGIVLHKIIVRDDLIIYISHYGNEVALYWQCGLGFPDHHCAGKVSQIIFQTAAAILRKQAGYETRYQSTFSYSSPFSWSCVLLQIMCMWQANCEKRAQVESGIACLLCPFKMSQHLINNKTKEHVMWLQSKHD